MMRDLCGETVDDYQISELIGVGGMGVVYRATQAKDGAEVAFKVLFDSFEWKRDEFVARFEREARALARLEHPGIVRILANGKQDNIYYIVTEYVDGTNLAQRLRSGSMELDEIVDIMSQICPALTFAHKNGVVHRDIKPANVMVANGSVKILDFGLAQMTGGDSQFSSLTRTDLAMGTFNYLSPEQRTNAKLVDQRSDIFSLGVVFFEMLTGTLPLGNFHPPSRIRQDADKICDRIVARSLSADPADRYQNVEELAADLEQIGTGRPRRRIALLAGAAGMAGVAAAIGLALFLGTGDGNGEDDPSDLQLMQGAADKGQIPPFVDIGQVQQAVDPAPAIQAANEPLVNADAPGPPPTTVKPVTAPNAKKIVKKKPVKKKPGKKKSGGKVADKGFGGKGSDGLDDLLSDNELDKQPAPSVKKPAPLPEQPAETKNPPAQTEQKKTKGKKKSKSKFGSQIDSQSTK